MPKPHWCRARHSSPHSDNLAHEVNFFRFMCRATSTLTHLSEGRSDGLGTKLRPHGKASGLGTFEFVLPIMRYIYPYIHDVCYFSGAAIVMRRNKFEIAMFPDHRFSCGLITRLHCPLMYMYQCFIIASQGGACKA